MNTFQLECFIAVATALNFARAAEQLSVSQPAVTHQIKTLEDELEVKLFHRSTRMVELTPEGKIFLTDAKSLLAMERHSKMRFRSTSEEHIESISIGCTNYIQLAMLTPVLKQLNEETSNLRPRLFVEPYEQLFQYLETERLDIFFGAYNQTPLKNSIKYKELMQSNIVCVCKKEHTLAEKECLSVEDLKQETLIFCDPMSLAPEAARLQYRLGENRLPTDIHFCSSSAAAYVLARSGFGVALLPDILVPDDPEITKIALLDSPSLSFGIFYRPSVGDELKHRFISLAKSIFDESST